MRWGFLYIATNTRLSHTYERKNEAYLLIANSITYLQIRLLDCKCEVGMLNA